MTQLYLYCTDRYFNLGTFILKDCKIETLLEDPLEINVSKRIDVDSVFYHYLIKELFLSDLYRTHFIQNFTKKYKIELLKLYLLPTKYNLIDYNWNERVYELVRERCELDHTLSWLSTLGGAFSALGDYFATCAETAGKISVHQLKLALRLCDPSIAARCKLYLSLSLIQKKKYKLARWIIEREYKNAKSATVVDTRLLNMCRGIWSKLQYEYALYRKKLKHLP